MEDKYCDAGENTSTHSEGHMGSQWVSVMLGILSRVTESRGAENADYHMCPI